MPHISISSLIQLIFCHWKLVFSSVMDWSPKVSAGSFWHVKFNFGLQSDWWISLFRFCLEFIYQILQILFLLLLWAVSTIWKFVVLVHTWHNESLVWTCIWNKVTIMDHGRGILFHQTWNNFFLILLSFFLMSSQQKLVFRSNGSHRHWFHFHQTWNNLFTILL